MHINMNLIEAAEKYIKLKPNEQIVSYFANPS